MANKERTKVAKAGGDEVSPLVIHSIRKIEKTGKFTPLESADAVAFVETPYEKNFPFASSSIEVFLVISSFTYPRGKVSPGIFVPKAGSSARWDQLKKVSDLNTFIIKVFTKLVPHDDDDNDDGVD